MVNQSSIPYPFDLIGSHHHIRRSLFLFGHSWPDRTHIKKAHQTIKTCQTFWYTVGWLATFCRSRKLADTTLLLWGISLWEANEVFGKFAYWRGTVDSTRSDFYHLSPQNSATWSAELRSSGAGIAADPALLAAAADRWHADEVAGAHVCCTLEVGMV